MKSPEIWSTWCWKVDQRTLMKVLDSSPNETLKENWKEDSKDWISAIGLEGAWYGPEHLFLLAFVPVQIEVKQQWAPRPEKKPLKKKKPRGPEKKE